VQRPHPPILLGGESRYTLQRVVELCDGWYPRGRAPEKVLAGMKELRELAAKAGRDMKTISVSAFATPADKAVLDQFAAAGVTRSILLLPPEPRDKILPLLDQYAKLVK
jgi:alkanesulfonate monooxygenase SsuD/methylene tetrahydromethanopterin reductase-like flavin-dependent oxidoreductase (luciferase family)